MINIGQMEKALVHSSPSSASNLLPAASTSTNAAEAQGQGFVSQDLPVTKRLFAGDLDVNFGFLQPAHQSADLVVR